jgi:tetratricopeptide (TPR) repeat protein
MMKQLAAVFALSFVLTSAVHAQDRVDEIWTHVDNRVVRQLDTWFDDGEFPAIVELLRVQVAYDSDYDNVTNLGWMLENIERYEEVPKVYLDYQKKHPEDPDCIYPLGHHYYIRKNYKRTIEVLEPSLKRNPTQNTYVILAKSYEREKMFKDAIRVWELQLKRWPDNGPAKVNIERVKKKISG